MSDSTEFARGFGAPLASYDGATVRRRGSPEVVHSRSFLRCDVSIEQAWRHDSPHTTHHEVTPRMCSSSRPIALRLAAEEQKRIQLRRLIEDEAICIVFQPIVSLCSGETIGYEALSRPDPEYGFAHAGQLFETAEQCGALPELEMVCRRATFAAAAAGWSDDALRFLNCSPPVFGGATFLDLIAADLKRVDGLDSRRIVLEITERADHGEFDNLDLRSLELREQGYQIALDDVGAGTSGLNRIMSLRPNWLKLDIELISGIDVDPFKQNLIRFFVRFSKLSNMVLIGEGIEREEELAMLIELGVTHGQGYYLARPDATLPQLDARTRRTVVSLSRQADARRFEDVTTVRVGTLAIPVNTCDQSDAIADVYAQMTKRQHSLGAVVFDQDRCVGWLACDRIKAMHTQGETGAPIGTASVVSCPVVGAEVTLAEALEISASRTDDEFVLPLIVQGADRIAGVVTPRRLLLAAARAHHHAPVHIAPLTGLPGRVQADQWLTDRIKAAADPMNIAFIDIRDFDAYNRSYGFEMGDVMLRRLVGLIRGRFVEPQDRASLFAHLGEDRFLVALASDGRDRLRDLIKSFKAYHAEFFSPVDQAAQAFWYADSVGRRQSLPLTSLRVVYLPNVLQSVRDARALYDLARRLHMQIGDDPAIGNEIITDDRSDIDDDAEGMRRRACA